MKKIISLVLIGILGLMVFTGCGKSKKAEAVSTEGSTSMEKTIGTLGERFEEDNKIKVTYNPTGSSAGIQSVLDKRCDIGLASRKLKDEEKSSGLEETVLAYDGIAIILNKENSIKNINLVDLQKIYKGEITNWKDLGGKDSPIVLIGREAGSGTRDGFEEVTETKDACKYNQELTATGDVITTVAGNPNAIGYASLAAVSDKVNVVKIDNVSPNEKSIKDGKYPIQRPFMLVTCKDKKLSGSAKEFFDYATSKEARELIEKSGVVPAK